MTRKKETEKILLKKNSNSQPIDNLLKRRTLKNRQGFVLAET